MSYQIVAEILDDLVDRYPVLVRCKTDIWQAYQILEKCYRGNNKLLIAGNGGSSADADHIVGELMKGFKLHRKIPSNVTEQLLRLDEKRGRKLSDNLQGALPAIALHNHTALSTAYLNDVDGTLAFAQQVYGYGVKDDVLLAISTSGNSENVIQSALVAKVKGLKVIALSGKSGGYLKELAEVSIVVGEDETYKIQELHLPIYHALCLMLEYTFFD